MARVLSIASFRRALPSFDRCERPSESSLRLSGFQPGRLAQGPEEKCARSGRTAGFAGVVIAMSPILTDGLVAVGSDWPAADMRSNQLPVNESGLFVVDSFAIG